MSLTNASCCNSYQYGTSDVISYNASNPRPAVGQLDKLYIDIDTGEFSYWDGSSYQSFTSGSTSSFVNNGDGTYTHDDGNGTISIIDTNDDDTTVIDNGDGTYTVTNDDGSTYVIDTNHPDNILQDDFANFPATGDVQIL